MADRGVSLSLSGLYQEATETNKEAFKLQFYLGLVQWGISIILGSVGIFAILYVIFLPTLDFIPYGKIGEALVGLTTFFIAFKLFKFLKLSNWAVRVAGRSGFGEDNVVFSMSLEKRLGVLLLTAIVLVGDIYLGQFGFVFVTSRTFPSPTIESFSNILLIVFELGITNAAIGLGLVFWGLSQPAWFALRALWRGVFLKAQFFASGVFEKVWGVSYSPNYEIFCDRCNNPSFVVVDSSENSEMDYEILCENCSEGYGEIDLFKWESIHDDDILEYYSEEPDEENRW